MPFPLPECPEYRKLVVTFWLDDVDDRLSINDLPGAESSWKTANSIYLSLPPGNGDMDRRLACPTTGKNQQTLSSNQ